MKLCDICLKTFRDNYALKRHQSSKACKDIANDTQKTIILNKNYTYNNENRDNSYNISTNNNTNNNENNRKTIIIDNSYTINNEEDEEYKSYKKIIISSKKRKSDEMVTKEKINRKTINNITEKVSINEKYDFSIEPKIVKKGDIFNCSLCHTEFKYRNNFYRHKKKCPIILKSL
tara:strand:+ start:52 stop:576 length:525 start_codon:yes stop_codon:yes gene_type:complete